jgi:hypothetical protein
MQRRRPNLFVVGAMKAGSTTLHYLLGAHPDVHMSPAKEPGFFCDHAELARHNAPAAQMLVSRDEGAYLDLFTGAKGARWAGESSTYYTKRPLLSGVPERIVRFAPDARIVYIMRDPVERSISHYLHQVRAGLEPRSARAALTAGSRYCRIGDYPRQLGPYLDVFGRESVFVLTLEDLRAHRQQTLAGLFRWLEVDPSAAADIEPQHRNQTPARDFAPHVGWGAPLHRVSPALYRLSRRIPWKLRRLVRELAVPKVRIRSLVPADVEARLRRIHTRHVRELEALLEMSFPAWSRCAAAG